jgi:quercetin dioxygenase-like cupin family protein
MLSPPPSVPFDLIITPTETISIRARTPDVLEVEALLAPARRTPAVHEHPAQDESFEVLEGAVRVWVDGEERLLGPGDMIDIPRGTAHATANAGTAPARMLVQVRPAGRTEQFFRALDALQRAGRVDADGLPDAEARAVLLDQYRDVFRLPRTG